MMEFKQQNRFPYRSDALNFPTTGLDEQNTGKAHPSVKALRQLFRFLERYNGAALP
jgi:hypothetical protein